MSAQLDFSALDSCLRGLDYLFIDIGRLTPETEYEEQIGGYGTVRVSTLDSGSPGAMLVAAKTIRLKDRHEDPKRLVFRLTRELKIWAGFRHPHVLPLMGYYLDKGYRIAVLISQYMIHGDLKEYIDQEKPLWDARLHLVCDLTDGLAYLHEQTPSVVHGDIKMSRRVGIVNPSIDGGHSQLFWSTFKSYLEEKGAVVELPKFRGETVELPKRFFIVGALGGCIAVRVKQLWLIVGAKLGFLDFDAKEAPQPRLALIGQLSAIYQTILTDFETHWRNSLGPTDPNFVFPLPPQLQFLQPEIDELATILFHEDVELHRTLHIEPQHETNVGAKSASSILADPENMELDGPPSLAADTVEMEVTHSEDPKAQILATSGSHIVERALAILRKRPLPTFQKCLPLKQTSEGQALSNGEYSIQDVGNLLIEAEEL
ncbi:hypothetical protein FS837_006405 [Tulasnella sp. UAMH 9824]|nr:hypothetical protein FS837_006405 [Tulasnella sp. UAMH 9824]